jgi:hypothetical protein
MAGRERTRFLQLMLTDAELDQLRARAEQRALPLSTWARMVLLEQSQGSQAKRRRKNRRPVK